MTVLLMAALGAVCGASGGAQTGVISRIPML